MKCLIIAAGAGTRLYRINKADSKPLLPLLGLPLIERTILTAHKAGIQEFYVVTGYNSKKLCTFLESLAKRRGLNIKTLFNEEWEKGNGLSVLKGKEVLIENFVLLMSDHLFDEEIVKDLTKQEIGEDEVILAVDFRVDKNEFVDQDDVTRVLCKDEKIVNIGKHIEDYNCYDTGIFLCSPAIFSAIERSAKEKNDFSLSGGMKLLSSEGKARVFDIGERFWLDVDDEKAFKKGEEYLLKGLTKSSDGPVSRYLNRPVSKIFTKSLVKTSLTPNQISFLTFLLSLVAAALIFFEDYLFLALGGVLVQISSIADGSDGEVARLKFQVSEFGGWFDAVLDRYADAIILFALVWHAFYFSPGFFITEIEKGVVLFVGMLAIIGSFMNSYTADKYDGLMKKRIADEAEKSGSYFRIGRDVRLFLVFLGCVLYILFPILLILAFVMNIENIRRVILCSGERKTFH